MTIRTDTTVPIRPTPTVQPIAPPEPLRTERPIRLRRPRWSLLIPFALLGILLLWWYLATREGSGFMRATPSEVGAAFQEMISSGTLFQHIGATLAEMLLGYSLGVVLAFILGYSVAKLAPVQQLILPYLIGLQAIPIVAIAPLLITYLGPGLVTNGIICALIVFFPMLITTNVAFRAIPPEYRDFMRTVSASPWQTFVKLELPTALPVIFGGLKVSTSLAVIGAVVGEGVSAEYGLGYLVYYSRYVFNQSSVFVGLITLMVVAYGFYEAVAGLERLVLRWRTVRDAAS